MTAPRRHQSWTQEEIRECFRDDITTIQMASNIGRSVAAVRNLRFRMQHSPRQPISLEEHDACIHRCLTCSGWMYGRMLCSTCFPRARRAA